MKRHPLLCVAIVCSTVIAPNVSCPEDIYHPYIRTLEQPHHWYLGRHCHQLSTAFDASGIIYYDDAGNVVVSNGTYEIGTTTITCNGTDYALNAGSCLFNLSYWRRRNNQSDCNYFNNGE
ncbi:uncharacterized protein LOC110984015 isoform X2 [Acanthaster planci]|uniref:Uncharacterized protein LOC110984015 isoform X2 n=1 Tax=Acanthaster planci TaxID=133434 RepID=A0A8B7Z3Z1_ACAPL|nr:uncharacterized protein LOC110984015 isoform X2 [Acanthaster planci]